MADVVPRLPPTAKDPMEIVLWGAFVYLLTNNRQL